MSELTVDSTAREMAAAVRRREISRARAARPPPGPDRRAQPPAERDRLARRGARSCGRGRRRRGDRAGRRARAAARSAVRVQGHPRRRRLAYDVRLAAVRRPRAGRRRPRRRADPGGRRGHDREDQRAGVRGRARTPSTPSSAPPSTRSTRPGRPAAPAEERRAPCGRGWCRSPTAPTWAARCATPRRSAASSGCARRWGACRPGRPTTSGRRTRSSGPLARNVGDLALLLSVIAGPDPRVPTALGRARLALRAAARRRAWPGCASR